jgi:xanthine/CO dehydrogenase XdhC/CoxF family maturation factor
MNENRVLVDAFDEAIDSGERCAIATLVSVEGSSYRRPGAKMLIREDGGSAGTISAGCLESDLIEHAKRVITDGRAKLVEYNTTSTSDEIAWGLGLGCNGIVRVLVEPLSPDSLYIESLRNSCDLPGERPSTTVVTVYEIVDAVPGRTDVPVGTGARVVVGGDGGSKYEGLEEEAADSFERSLADQWKVGIVPGANAVSVNGSLVRVFVETLSPPVPLMIFGAGQDALPIVELANGLGWRTEVVDPQRRPASLSRFAIADKTTLSRPDEVAANVTVTPHTFAVLMTHNYAHDLELLGLLLDSPAAYIGVMGPKKRTKRMLDELRARRGTPPSEEDLARLYSPVGLDIGANSPFEIALSIVGEMKAVKEGRGGGLLRERRGSIHGRPSDAEPVVIVAERNARSVATQS